MYQLMIKYYKVSPFITFLVHLRIPNHTNMKKNMGTIDKTIRIIIAAVVAGLYYAGTISGTLGIVLLVLAGVFVLTSLVSFCPLYTVFGISTCPNKQ